MQPHLVHQLVHDKGGAGHIAAVLHKGDEEIQNQDVGQENEHRAHAGDDAVADEALQRSVAHDASHHVAQPAEQRLQPIHRVLPHGEGAEEGDEHHHEEDRIAQPTVRHHGVNLVRQVVQRTLLVALVAFGQCTAHESVFGVGDGALDVLVRMGLARMGFTHMLRVIHRMAVVFQVLVGNLVAHLRHAAVRVALLHILFQLLVVLQQFDGQEAGGKRVAEAVFVELGT